MFLINQESLLPKPAFETYICSLELLHSTKPFSSPQCVWVSTVHAQLSLLMGSYPNRGSVCNQSDGTVVFKYLYSNMVLVIDTLWLAQKSNNWRPLFRFRSGRPFLPIVPLQVTLLLPTWSLKSPSRTMEPLFGALFSTHPKDSKKDRYSELLIGNSL